MSNIVKSRLEYRQQNRFRKTSYTDSSRTAQVTRSFSIRTASLRALHKSLLQVYLL